MTESVAHRETEPEKSLPFNIAKWQGYVIAAMYLLYGGVKIIFGILDNDYSNFTSLIFWFGFGVVLIMFVLAYSGHKLWGWIGLLVFNAYAAIWSLAKFSEVGSAAVMVLALIGIVALLWPSTRQTLSGN